MIIFKKDNTSDIQNNRLIYNNGNHPTVEVTIDDSSSIDELFVAFKGFLQASGYPIDSADEIILNEYEEPEQEKEMESVEVDLTEEQFSIIAQMAHERDITFNEMCCDILRESMSRRTIPLDITHD